MPSEKGEGSLPGRFNCRRNLSIGKVCCAHWREVKKLRGHWRRGTWEGFFCTTPRLFALSGTRIRRLLKFRSFFAGRLLGFFFSMRGFLSTFRVSWIFFVSEVLRFLVSSGYLDSFLSISGCLFCFWLFAISGFVDSWIPGLRDFSGTQDPDRYRVVLGFLEASIAQFVGWSMAGFLGFSISRESVFSLRFFGFAFRSSIRRFFGVLGLSIYLICSFVAWLIP